MNKKTISSSYSNIEQKHIGSHSELKACIWLQKQGFEVFKNMSSAGEIDLIIWDPKTNEMHKIDVTTAHFYQLVDGTSKVGYARYKKQNCISKGMRLLIVYPETTEAFWDEEVDKCLLK